MFQIAFSGVLSPSNITFLKHLLEKGNRLLLAENGTFSEVPEKLQNQSPGAEIEIATCLKDSCWQADVIILSSEIINDTQALRNLKEVATQKPVIYLSEDSNSEDFYTLEQLLPHSKLALVKLDPEIKQAIVQMTSEEAELKQFFDGIDYQLVPKMQEC